MIDLGLNQDKITEIKYELKEGKTVIFKLRDFNLEDVEIVDKNKKEEVVNEENVTDEKKEFNLNEIMQTTKPKQLHDYEPISSLKNEKGMQETLEAARHKQWKEDVINNPSKPTETGNALIKEDKSNLKESITGYKNRNNYTKSNLAESEEIKVFNFKQKQNDLIAEKYYKDKIEKKEATRRIIQKMANEDSEIIKERIEDRNQDKYYKLDPNDEYSSIKSLNDVDGKPLEIKKEENKIENETNR